MDFEIRKDRTPQGPRELGREREAHSRLMQQGYGDKEACRIVGIGSRTGTKWRNGRRPTGTQRKALPPLRAVAEPSGPSRHLGEADRIHIADRLREKATVRVIAAELGRASSTVSREIRRNRHPDSGRYRPHAAQARADARRPRPKVGKIGRNRGCATSSRTTCADGGARNRFATLFGNAFPIGRRCTWSTR